MPSPPPMTTSPTNDPLDFDESEFFGDDDSPLSAGDPVSAPDSSRLVAGCGVHSDAAASDSSDDDGIAISDCSSSDDDDSEAEHSLRVRLQSLQSSLTQPTPMEELGVSHGSHHGGSQVGSLKTFGSGPMSRNFGSENDLAVASLPVGASMPYNISRQHTHHRPRRVSSDAALKLGTSMPIGIPMMQHHQRRSALVSGPGAFDVAGEGEEFVPPHLLEHEGPGDMREMFRSVGGLSPNAAMKRERLAQRNYIMRATGFLESAPLAAPMGEVTDVLRENLNGAEVASGLGIPKPFVRVPTQTSSLSAALGLGTTPQ